MRTDRDKRRLPAFLLVVSLIAGLLTGCVVTFQPVEEVQSVTTQPTTLPEPTETEPEPTEPDPNEIVNSGVCGDDVSWTLTAGGTLTISGSGPMWEYENTSDRPFPQKEVKRIVIQSGITRISRNAFLALSM